MPGAISFAVGAIFEIEDRASATLRSLSEQVARLDEQFIGLQSKMTAFGKDGEVFGGLVTGISKVSDALDSIVGAATKASAGMTEAMAKAGDSVKGLVDQINTISQAYSRAASAASRFASAAGGGGQGRRRRAEDDIDGTGPRRNDDEEIDGIGPRRNRETGGLPTIFGGGFMGGAVGGYTGERMSGGGGGDDAYDAFRRYEAGRARQIGGPSPLRLRGPGDGGPIPYGYEGPDEPFDEYRPGRRRGHVGMAPLVEGAALLESMKSAAQEEQSIDIALLRGFHIDPRTATDEQRSFLKNLAAKGAAGTSFTETEVAAGEATLASPLGFLGDEGMRKFGTIFEVAAKAAEAAKQLKFGTFEGSLTGAVEFAHQMQLYDAPGLTKGMNLLGAITESLPQGDMAREALVMGYAIPQARALGADPEEAMTAIGFMQRGGLRNTVASTTLRQMLVGQLKTGGPVNAHMRRSVDHEAKELETALGLKEGHFSGKAGEKGNPHVDALRDLGLLRDGKLTDLNARGGIDINRMFEIIANAESTMTPMKFGGAMYNAFGIRGQTGGEMVGESFDKFKEYQRTVGGTAPLDEQLKMIQGNAVQLTGQALARIGDVGNALGETFLGHLKEFDNLIIGASISLRELIKEHPVATEGIASGIIGATVATGLLGLRGAVGAVGRFFGMGAGERVVGTGVGVAGEALGGAGILGTLGRTLLGPVGMALSIPAMMSLFSSGNAGAPQAKGLPSIFYDDQGHMKWPWQSSDRPGSNTQAVTPRAIGPNDRGQVAGAPAASPPPAPNVVTMTNTFNINGLPDATTMSAIIARLTEAMRSALATATGSGQGTSTTPYIGAGVP